MSIPGRGINICRTSFPLSVLFGICNRFGLEQLGRPVLVPHWLKKGLTISVLRSRYGYTKFERSVSNSLNSSKSRTTLCAVREARANLSVLGLPFLLYG